MADTPKTTERDIVFISKATPGDDEFVLWLAPRLEAAGYKVFADILALQPGDRWRREITGALQDRAIKMLLCCRDDTLAKEGVQEEIGIGLDLAKSLSDPRFVMPLRLEPYKKVFGIGELQYTDFVRGWAQGLDKLLDALKRQHVPRSDDTQISPHWDAYRRRLAIAVKAEPERLTSNWLRIAEIPDVIRYYEPKGAADLFAIKQTCAGVSCPVQPQGYGVLTFLAPDELGEMFAHIAGFQEVHQFPLMEFIDKGAPEIDLKAQDASNLVTSMFRQAWNIYCRERGLMAFAYSGATGFHVQDPLAKLGERVPWGKQGERRSSMLRNIAKGHAWSYGVSGQAAFWPYPHFKLKSRVLFAPVTEDKAEDPYDDAKKQHRLRRSVCKGWRNKQWHGRLLAFLELLAGDNAYLHLPLGPTTTIKVEAGPVLFTSPVSTVLPDVLDDEQEEHDESTLGRPELEEEAA